MADPAIISAVYTEWKMVKTRSALVLCFEVPLEHQAMVQEALGTPLPDKSIYVAIARLVEGAVARPGMIEAPRKGTLAQQAGILCNEVAFQRYVAETDGLDGSMPVEGCAAFIRSLCGVGSRAELDKNDEAAGKFLDLRADYKVWLSGVAA